MATLGPGQFTLLDLGRRIDDGGKVMSIAEMMTQTNEMLLDVIWKEGNLTTGERYAVRNSLPTVTWRKFNEGVAPSKSTTAQVVEGCALLEAWSEIDKELADLGGNPDAVRISEAKAFIQAMSIECQAKFFYGDVATTPETFDGLAKRYNSTSGNLADQIVLGGGSGADNASIYFVVFSPETVYGFYPKGTKAGLEHKDWGAGIIETTAGIAGNRMVGYRDQFIWRVGLAVKDARYVVRIPNIDISALLAGSGADLFDLMIKAYHRLPSGFASMGRSGIYMNRTVYEMLDIQTRNDVSTGGQLTYQMVDGMPTRTFRNIPVRVCDALTIAETLVS